MTIISHLKQQLLATYSKVPLNPNIIMAKLPNEFIQQALIYNRMLVKLVMVIVYRDHHWFVKRIKPTSRHTNGGFPTISSVRYGKMSFELHVIKAHYPLPYNGNRWEFSISVVRGGSNSLCKPVVISIDYDHH